MNENLLSNKLPRDFGGTLVGLGGKPLLISSAPHTKTAGVSGVGGAALSRHRARRMSVNYSHGAVSVEANT